MCRYIGPDYKLFLGGRNRCCVFFSNLTIVDGNLQSFAFFYFAKFFRKMCLKCGSKLGYRALLGGIFSA